MRLCDLRNKQVINCKDCQILGYAGDVIFDENTGCITDIIVPGPGKLFCCLGREIEYIIPFKCICCIGPEIILIDANTEKLINKCT